MTQSHNSSAKTPWAAWIHLGLTWARYQLSAFRARGMDTSPLEQLRATPERDTFFVIGPGASLNYLSEGDRAQIRAGVSLAVNMAALAPIDFDICALEAIHNETDYDAYRKALLSKARTPVIWFQDRKKHTSTHVLKIEREFGLFRYKRVSVSIKKKMPYFELAFQRLILPRVFDTPDLGLCFALTGSIARATLLGLALGYRRIRFIGIDLGSTPYFWMDDAPETEKIEQVDVSSFYLTDSPGAHRQGSASVVPNFYQFLAALAKARPELDFATIDPARRSRLTPFLETLAQKR